MLLAGQWATPVPVWARSRSSSSLKWMPWAYQTSSPTHSSFSRKARGRIPSRSSMYRSSSFVSHRWVWRRTRYCRASPALSRSRSSLTEKGEQGARTTWRMDPGRGSW